VSPFHWEGWIAGPEAGRHPRAEQVRTFKEKSMFQGKRVTPTLTFAVLAMIICAPSAFGQTTSNDISFSNVSVMDDCTQEMVLMNGTVHTATSFSSNPNGTTHFKFDFTEHATGIGQTSGVNYVINDNSHEEVNTKGIAQEQFVGTKMKMISQGPSPNLTERSTLHVVIDSNNNVKVDKSKTQISCK
jgi:hypothetical protein